MKTKKKEKMIGLMMTETAASYLQAALEKAMDNEGDPTYRHEYRKLWTSLTTTATGLIEG